MSNPFGQCNEISTLTVNYVRIINHFSTSLITYCKPWRNGINTVKRTQFSLIDFSKILRKPWRKSFRRFVVSLPRFVSSSILQFRLVSCYRFVISTFHCFTFLLRFVVPLAISSCRRHVLSFPCFDSSLLSSFCHFHVSFRRFVSPFRFAVLTALDWEREKVQFACPLHEAVIVVCPRWQACWGLKSH